MYRAPGSDHWKEVSLDWMLDTVAKRIWETRNKGFVEKDPKTGITVNNCANIGFIGRALPTIRIMYHLLENYLPAGLGFISGRKLSTLLPLHDSLCTESDIWLRCLHQSSS